MVQRHIKEIEGLKNSLKWKPQCVEGLSPHKQTLETPSMLSRVVFPMEEMTICLPCRKAGGDVAMNLVTFVTVGPYITQIPQTIDSTFSLPRPLSWALFLSRWNPSLGEMPYVLYSPMASMLFQRPHQILGPEATEHVTEEVTCTLQEFWCSHALNFTVYMGMG